MSNAFGTDFSSVRVHTGSNAVQMNQGLNARAFTHGSDVYFNKGEYSPNSSNGKSLLAHELTHVVQQGGARNKVQRAWVPDSGYRFTPPASVSRTVREIQAVVGTTPDGVYGINTRNAVRKYQKRLKDKGLFNGTPNGEWGSDTDIAHIAHATGSSADDYNCSGLAFKTFRFHGWNDNPRTGTIGTRRIVASMTRLRNCRQRCRPRQYKFFLWNYNITFTDTRTGRSHTSPDFHIVGGQTDGAGNGPAQVVSKNGGRPVYGPAPPLSWKPPSSETATVSDHTERPIPGVIKTRSGYVETCFCSDTLP